MLIGRTWGMLSQQEARRGICSIASMIGLALMDLIGISLIIPVAGLFVGHSQGQLSRWLTIESLSTQQLFILMLVVLLTFFAFKTFLQHRFLSCHHQFIARLAGRIGTQALAYFLSQNLDDGQLRNRTHLFELITEQADAFANLWINGWMQGFSESLVILLLLGFMLFWQFTASLILLAAFGVIALVLVTISRSQMRALAYQHAQAKSCRNIALDNALRGVPEIKSYQAESYCLAQFSLAAGYLGEALGKYRTAMQFPRYLIELLSMVGICLTLALLFIFHHGNTAIVSFIVFGAVALRLLPSVIKMISAIHHLNFGRHAFLILAPLLQDTALPSKALKKKSIQHTVDLVDVTYRYPESNDVILNNYSVSFKAQKVTGISGPSGCGKSTLAKVLAGLAQPLQGKILVDKRVTQQLAQFNIGYVPQDIYIANSSVLDNVTLGLETMNIAHAQQCLEVVGLAQLISSWPEGLHKVLGDQHVCLSGGEQQRLGIARALYRKPNLLILDETFAGLDEANERKLISALKHCAFVHILVIISHRNSTLKQCDTVIQLGPLNDE